MISKKSVNKIYFIFLLIIFSSSSFINNKAQEIKWEKTKYKEDTNDPKEIDGKGTIQILLLMNRILILLKMNIRKILQWKIK